MNLSLSVKINGAATSINFEKCGNGCFGARTMAALRSSYTHCGPSYFHSAGDSS